MFSKHKKTKSQQIKFCLNLDSPLSYVSTQYVFVVLHNYNTSSKLLCETMVAKTYILIKNNLILVYT